ncbi:MAG: hypothetical protein LBI84_04245 [Propionibacteriaceae bacterium]|jgi:hypothetical protein|nr:hypothetical protein [Propionibacteriaceae bacterium]
MLVVALLTGAALAAGSAAAWAEDGPVSRDGVCTVADKNAVSLVIDYQDLGREPEAYCVSNLDADVSGADLLRIAGVEVTGTAQGNGFICRLNGLPAPDQAIGTAADPGYVETCATTPPPTAYWSYWQAEPGGDWEYSLRGAGTSRVNLGGFEGFSFSHDAADPGVTAPRTAPTAAALGSCSIDATSCGPDGATASPAAAGAISPAAEASPAAATAGPAVSPGALAAIAAIVVLGLLAAGLAARRARSRPGRAG